MKINWGKIAKIGGCVLTGVIAFMGALADEKQASKILELEARLAQLESK
jgi:hypothetical protein